MEARRVFVSYTNEDAPRVEALIEGLRNHGVECWHMRGDRTLDRYASEIEQEISNSCAIVIAYSGKTSRSRGCRREVELADKASKPIVVVRLDNSEFDGGFGYYLAELTPVVWTTADDAAGEVASRLNASSRALRPSKRSRPRLRLIGLSVAVAVILSGAALATTKFQAAPSRGGGTLQGVHAIPCQNPKFDGASPGPVASDLQIEYTNDKCRWSRELNVAQAGSAITALASYQNRGRDWQHDTAIAIRLPKVLALIPNSTRLYNGVNPNGVTIATDVLAQGGVVIGDYGPQAHGYLTFRLQTARDRALPCGWSTHEFSAVVSTAEELGANSTATVRLFRNCN